MILGSNNYFQSLYNSRGILLSVGSSRPTFGYNQLFVRYASNSLNSLLNQRLGGLTESDRNSVTAFAGDGHSLLDTKIENIDISSSLSESFPWLVDETGSPIDFTRPITVFEAVKYLSHFLKTKYGMINYKLIKSKRIYE